MEQNKDAPVISPEASLDQPAASRDPDMDGIPVKSRRATWRTTLDTQAAQAHFCVLLRLFVMQHHMSRDDRQPGVTVNHCVQNLPVLPAAGTLGVTRADLDTFWHNSGGMNICKTFQSSTVRVVTASRVRQSAE